MNLKKTYKKLKRLNGDFELDYALKCVEKYKIQKDKPFCERLSFRENRNNRKGLIDYFCIEIKLTRKNRLVITKEYNDHTDYGLSAMSTIDWSTSEKVVDIKLKTLLEL